MRLPPDQPLALVEAGPGEGGLALQLSEALAAGWPEIAQKGGRFLDPMAGSGTLAVEAAHRAQNRAPGSMRKNFAFMHLLGFRHRVWEGLLREAEKRVQELEDGRFLISDKDPAQMQAARHNPTE